MMNSSLFGFLLISTFILSVRCCKSGLFINGGVCIKCTPFCDGGRVIVRPCNKTADILCRCPPEKYWDTEVLFCKGCLKCDPGQIAKKQCQHDHNRDCQQCPPGTYAKSQFTSICKKCLHCKQGEVVFQRCNASMNTICGSAIQLTTSTRPALTEEQGTWYPKDTERSNNGVHQTLVIAIVSALVVIIIILITVMIWSKCNASDIKKSDISSDDSTESDTFVNKKTMTVTHDPGFLVRNMNPEVVIKLARLLNPPGLRDWRNLAALLGFSQIDIQNFAITQEEACQKVLEAWGTTREATVFILYQVFKKMQRDDCSSILEEVLTRDCV